MHQHVNIFVLTPRSVTEDKGVSLEVFNPFHMSRVEFLLGIEIPKCLMIKVQDKFLRVRGSDVNNIKHHRIEFLIINDLCFASSFSFSLKKAIGCFSWLNTSSIPTLDVSRPTSKTLSKSGRCKTGAWVILYFISTKAQLTTFVQTKSTFLRLSLIGVVIVLKFLMNHRWNVASPWKLWTEWRELGSHQYTMA